MGFSGSGGFTLLCLDAVQPCSELSSLKNSVYLNIHSKYFSINDSRPPNDQMFLNMSEVSQMVFIMLCLVNLELP